MWRRHWQYTDSDTVWSGIDIGIDIMNSKGLSLQSFAISVSVDAFIGVGVCCSVSVDIYSFCLVPM